VFNAAMPSDTQAAGRSRPRALARSLTLAAAALLTGALAPAAADAKIIELGQFSSDAKPTCPGKPCLAISRTTGFQVKVGAERDFFIAPSNGRVVAWSVTLGAPTAKQIKFFNDGFGGPPSANITVMRPGDKLFQTAVSQSPVMQLTPYLGETVQFPLERTLAIKKGQLVALTVPTWAPALAIGFGNDTSWRASRGQGKCNDFATQTAMTTMGASTQFRCLNRTARLTYSVTMITAPHGPKKPAKSTTAAKKKKATTKK
jgi:hypothetical protein